MTGKINEQSPIDGDTTVPHSSALVRHQPIIMLLPLIGLCISHTGLSLASEILLRAHGWSKPWIILLFDCTNAKHACFV